MKIGFGCEYGCRDEKTFLDKIWWKIGEQEGVKTKDLQSQKDSGMGAELHADMVLDSIRSF